MALAALRGPAVPSIAGYQVQAAGHTWDAVRVDAHLGRAALRTFAGRSGAVIEDPRESALYWFVPQGATVDWDVPGTRALGLRQHLVVPGRERRQAPGPWWRIPPDAGGLLTDAVVLRGILLTAGRRLSGTDRVRTL